MTARKEAARLARMARVVENGQASGLAEAHALYHKRNVESVAAGAEPDKIALLAEIPDACTNCGNVVWVGPFERKKWICYRCGLSNHRSPPLAPPEAT